MDARQSSEPSAIQSFTTSLLLHTRRGGSCNSAGVAGKRRAVRTRAWKQRPGMQRTRVPWHPPPTAPRRSPFQWPAQADLCMFLVPPMMVVDSARGGGRLAGAQNVCRKCQQNHPGTLQIWAKPRPRQPIGSPLVLWPKEAEEPWPLRLWALSSRSLGNGGGVGRGVPGQCSVSSASAAASRCVHSRHAPDRRNQALRRHAARSYRASALPVGGLSPGVAALP